MAESPILRVVMVAGEASGDILGAGLIKALQRDFHGQVQVSGVGGPLMQAAGISAIFPAERLAIMGLTEVLKHLPDLLAARKEIVQHTLACQPDVFIGIDAPDFNLRIAKALKKQSHIKTVHYVSPSVWAWRPKRVFGIKKCIDLMLTLLPFEKRFYDQYAVKAEFVGHPLADDIQPNPDAHAARVALGLDPAQPVLAILPGSRGGEVSQLGEPYLQAASQLQQEQPNLQLLIPCANDKLKAQLQTLLAEYDYVQAPTLLDGQSRQVMAAADVILLASGTATLEALLMRRPMVVGYRVANGTARIVRLLKLMNIDRYSLPNLLTGQDVVPELIQEQLSAEALVPAISELLNNPQARQRMLATFEQVHQRLARDGDRRAAQAILALHNNCFVVERPDDH